MRSVAAWCALGINSLSRVCLSLIITCRPHWPVCLESAATRGARHVDLCIVCRWWNATSLTLSEFGSTLFTRHSHTNLHLANAVCINRLPCCITCTTRKLERSGDRITCSKERGGGEGIGSLQWQSKPWEPHRSTNHLAGNVISSNPLGSHHWSSVLLSDPVLKKTLYPCVRHFKGG